MAKKQNTKKIVKRSLQTKIIIRIILIVLGAIITMTALGFIQIANLTNVFQKRERAETEAIMTSS